MKRLLAKMVPLLSAAILTFSSFAQAQISIEPDTQHHLDPKLKHIKNVLSETYGLTDLLFSIHVRDVSKRRTIEAELTELVYEIGGELTDSLWRREGFKIYLGLAEDRRKYWPLSDEELRSLDAKRFIHEIKLYRSQESGDNKLLASYTTEISCPVVDDDANTCQLDRDTVRELMFRLFDRLVR